MNGPNTPELVDFVRYVREGGVRCPFCGSGTFEGGPFDCESGQVWQNLTCVDCDAQWQDVYRLSFVADPESGEGLKSSEDPLQLLRDLLTWEEERGGWEAPVWDRVRKFLGKGEE